MPRGQAIREALDQVITTKRAAKKARWERKNQIRPHRVGPPDTSSWIKGDPTMSATIAALAARAAPAVAASINKHFVPVFTAAQNQWPSPGNAKYSTGASRAALFIEHSLVDQHTLSSKIASPADYTWYIRSSGVHIGSALITKPGKVAVQMVADDLAARLGG